MIWRCWSSSGRAASSSATDGVTSMAEASPPSGAAAAGDPVPAREPEPFPEGLRRGAPLVLIDSAASRALVGGIAILTLLAGLCAGPADLLPAGAGGGGRQG